MGVFGKKEKIISGEPPPSLLWRMDRLLGPDPFAADPTLVAGSGGCNLYLKIIAVAAGKKGFRFHHKKYQKKPVRAKSQSRISGTLGTSTLDSGGKLSVVYSLA
jgi:hypothetical protein